MTANPATGTATGRLPSVLLKPPFESRFWVSAMLAVMVLTVGLWDYLSGSIYSLSPLYLVPVSLTALWYGARAGGFLALACFAIRMGGDFVSHEGTLPLNTLWNVCGMLVIHLLVIWLIQVLTGQHRQLEQRIAIQSVALKESEMDRYRLEMEILDVAARERSAFGRELHDEIGQHFVATALAAQALAEKLSSREGAGEAKAIVQWIEAGLDKARKLARGLLLARIEPERFAQELEELAISVNRGKVRCSLAQEGDEITADASRCAQLFRIAQEAVGNALRHGRPNAIRIKLVNDSQALNLSIEDDGQGFPDVAASKEGLGLRIMQHRARIIGASLSVNSAPGAGTSVLCRLPHGASFPP